MTTETKPTYEQLKVQAMEALTSGDDVAFLTISAKMRSFKAEIAKAREGLAEKKAAIATTPYKPPFAPLSLTQYLKLQERVYKHAKAIEPQDAQAAAAMTNTAMIALAKRDIVLGPDPRDEAREYLIKINAPAEAVKKLLSAYKVEKVADLEDQEAEDFKAMVLGFESADALAAFAKTAKF